MRTTFVHERHGREGSVFVQGLGTCIWSLSYDARTRTGTIAMPETYCTDMLGAITLFAQIDPAVARVITTEGGQLDTIYEHIQGHTWTAIADRPPRGHLVEIPGVGVDHPSWPPHQVLSEKIEELQAMVRNTPEVDRAAAEAMFGPVIRALEARRATVASS